jgi:hypothetical protein
MLMCLITAIDDRTGAEAVEADAGRRESRRLFIPVMPPISDSVFPDMSAVPDGGEVDRGGPDP